MFPFSHLSNSGKYAFTFDFYYKHIGIHLNNNYYTIMCMYAIFFNVCIKGMEAVGGVDPELYRLSLKRAFFSGKSTHTM